MSLTNVFIKMGWTSMAYIMMFSITYPPLKGKNYCYAEKKVFLNVPDKSFYEFYKIYSKKDLNVLT